MFDHAELQGTQMGPNGPPNAKETASIAPEIANYRKPGLWVILAILAKTAILVILASHFRARVDTPTKKSHMGSCLNQRDGATHGGGQLRSTTAPR